MARLHTGKFSEGRSRPRASFPGARGLIAPAHRPTLTTQQVWRRQRARKAGDSCEKKTTPPKGKSKVNECLSRKEQFAARVLRYIASHRSDLAAEDTLEYLRELASAAADRIVEKQARIEEELDAIGDGRTTF